MTNELSKFARDWLVSLRRESGGYPAEVLRHINAQADEIERLQQEVARIEGFRRGAELKLASLQEGGSHEPLEQRKIDEDVRLYGTGFAMHTKAGMTRLAPEEVSIRTRPRCLAMINEFGDKVCSLLESHGGPHAWVDSQGASRDLSASESVSFHKTLARSPRVVGPADLVGALQDVVHTDSGAVRPAHAVKSGENNDAS